MKFALLPHLRNNSVFFRFCEETIFVFCTCKVNCSFLPHLHSFTTCPEVPSIENYGVTTFNRLVLDLVSIRIRQSFRTRYNTTVVFFSTPASQSLHLQTSTGPGIAPPARAPPTGQINGRPSTLSQMRRYALAQTLSAATPALHTVVRSDVQRYIH